MKKTGLIALAVSLCCVFSFAACGNDNPEEQLPVNPPAEDTNALKKPQNVQVSEDGLVTWDAVANATEYIVWINGTPDFTVEPSYQLPVLTEDASITVVACADGYDNSAYSDEIEFKGKEPTAIAIDGKTEMHFGETKQYAAYINGEWETNVTWTVIKGKEFATISALGALTANKDRVDSNETVTIQATLNSDSKVTCTKTVLINGRPQLTQDMLDKVGQQQKMWFFGSVEIDAYNFTVSNELTDTYSLTVDTKLNGTNWYAEYMDGNTGMNAALYFKNDHGTAAQVSVSFMNDEVYTPMLDDNGNEVSWVDSGMYNNFEGLNVRDFTFNEESWLWEYTGSDSTLKNRMVAAANPYDFIPTNLSLLIKDGEIMGIHSVSEDDYRLVSGKRAVSKLFSYFDYSDKVEVPTIAKFEHDSKFDAQYEKFQKAIDKMQARESYTLNYVEDSYNVLGIGETVSGFKETITPTDCYFRPFECMRTPTGGYSPFVENFRYYTGDNYGYHKFGEDRYNSFHTEFGFGVGGTETKLVASRAYDGDFSQTKPSFAFSPDIFTAFYEDKQTGEITFYADEAMTPVASTFYYGVGTEIELYGLFATRGFSAGTNFTPYITVSAEGDIVDSGFYYYLGYLYGVVQIRYEDLNGAKLPEGVNIDFAEREVPTSYSQLEIINVETEDEHVNVLDHMKTLFGDEDIEERMPFFGDVLGDSFATGFVTNRLEYGVNGAPSVSKSAILLWYDVPLDKDYTIDSSIRKVSEFLREKGFTEQRGVFRNGDITIELVDNQLDFYIYIWKGSSD